MIRNRIRILIRMRFMIKKSMCELERVRAFGWGRARTSFRLLGCVLWPIVVAVVVVAFRLLA